MIKASQRFCQAQHQLKVSQKALIRLAGKECTVDPQFTNIPAKIQQLSERNLLSVKNHPLSILKTRISDLFPQLSSAHVGADAGRSVSSGSMMGGKFKVFDGLHPVVSIRDNFDRLLIPQDHVSRSCHDSYYLTSDTLLRTHTSAHQHTLISQLLKSHSGSNREKYDGFLAFADVYRRDEVDASHYPVFHQVEGVRLFSRSELDNPVLQNGNDADLRFEGDNCLQNVHQNREMDIQKISLDLRSNLEQIVRSLFTVEEEKLEMRWVESFFPFTKPSWELEVKYRGTWLEVAGCGIIQQSIIQSCLKDANRENENENLAKEDYIGWAFGMGLERIAMVLFDIPDIRLFWSTDPRFLSQFESGEIVKYKTISKYPSTHRDVSFWTSQEHGFHQNDLFEIVRDVAGDLAETVEIVDQFRHPKTGRESMCFRVTYRSVDCTLTNELVNEIQEKFIQELVGKLKVEIR